MSNQSLPVIDFHIHHVPARFEPTTTCNFPPGQRERWAGVNRKLADEALLLRDIDEGDLALRVVNTPAALIADATGNVDRELIVEINDVLAEVIGRHPRRLVGLATIDAYDGDRAAREVERAVRHLGFRGIFVDSARGKTLIDAPQARPALRAAAELGVPVFVHPVNPEPLTTQLAPYGRLCTLLARGTVNSAALVALLETGVFTELPKLRVVVTMLAFGGLALAGGFSDHSRLPGGGLETLRRHVFIDTMGFAPALIRASVDLLGAENVIAGSDWPIVNDGPIQPILTRALASAGLSEAESRAVAAGNSARLLGIAAWTQAVVR